MLSRTEAAKPNAIKLLASMASITLKPDVGGVTELDMLSTPHFSKCQTGVARAWVGCLEATALG